MRLYLADLFHISEDVQNPETRPCTVPLGIGFLAATLKQRMPHVDVRLFNDPDQLLHAVDTAPPDAIGFSLKFWNTDLSRRIAALIKKSLPQTVTVLGGPSIDDTDDQIADMLDAFTAADYAIPGEGENGLCALLRHLESGGGRDGVAIDGVAYTGPDGSLVRGSYAVPGAPKTGVSLDELIPSPYLNGTLDAFLDAGMVPIVQTMRGCPYGCEFCVSGTTLWNRPRGFDPDRVKAEIDYVLERSGHEDLILTDENWGILGDRDVDLARYILDRHQRTGYPRRLYYYTAKAVNDASRAIVEMVAPLAWLDQFTISYQTMNPESRKAIRRVNVSLDEAVRNVEWANPRGISVGSQLIFGFPYETLGTFIDGVETLLRAGIHKIQIYQLLLFPGIDLNSRKAREAYGITTRFRVTDSWYGVYNDGKLISVEAEEIVVSTKWASLDDYLRVRQYQFFAYALLHYELLLELTQLCRSAGVRTDDLIRHLVFTDYSYRPAMAGILAEHERVAREELQETEQEVYEEVASLLRAGEPVSVLRPNVLALTRILNSQEAVDELLGIVDEYVDRLFQNHSARDVVFTYVREVLPYRIVVLPKEPRNLPFEFHTRFDYARWQRRDFCDPRELLLDLPTRFEAQLQESCRRSIGMLDTSSAAGLQKFIDRTLPTELLRAVCSVGAVMEGVNELG